MSSVFPLRWMVMTQGCCWAEKKASSAVRSAGDMAAAELGERGMSPADLLSRLPYAFKETEQG